jgi:hypothetical protein
LHISQQKRQLLFDFEPVDSDQALHLIAAYPLSVSRSNQ